MNIEPVTNGFASTNNDERMYFVESVEGLRNLLIAYEVCADKEPTDEELNYIGLVIQGTAKLPFPRIVLLNVVHACRADGCRNDDEEDYTEILWSFGLLDTIDLTAQFSLRGYS